MNSNRTPLFATAAAALTALLLAGCPQKDKPAPTTDDPTKPNPAANDPATPPPSDEPGVGATEALSNAPKDWPWAGKTLQSVVAGADKIEVFRPMPGGGGGTSGKATFAEPADVQAAMALIGADAKLLEGMSRCMAAGSVDFFKGDERIASIAVCGSGALVNDNEAVLMVPGADGKLERVAGLAVAKGAELNALIEKRLEPDSE